jgi:ribosomal protein L37AE/L43A
MKSHTTSRKKDEPNFGFTPRDQRILEEIDNARSNPKIQLFMEEREEEEPTAVVQQQTRVCPSCENYNMKYWSAIGRWFCHTCGAKVDSDKGYKHITEDDEMYMPTAQLEYPTIGDADRDSSTPFFASIDPNREQLLEGMDTYTITWQSSRNGPFFELLIIFD